MFTILYNFIQSNILPTCCIMPLIGFLGVILGSKNKFVVINNNSIKQWTLLISILTFFYSLKLWIGFKNLVFSFQYVYKATFFFNPYIFKSIKYTAVVIIENLFNPLTRIISIRNVEDTGAIPKNGLIINFYMGLDGISLLFVILTTFIMPICILSIWNVDYKNNLYMGFLLLLELLLLLSFITLDLFYFYIFFESTLIPMFLIVGIWGSRSRKVKASYYFFLYTVLGSLFMLIAIIAILLEIGSTSYDVLILSSFSLKKQKLLWLLIFFALAVKVPMFPFHIWLPEAHVEAPTAGSVILASLLLKMGGYGFLRFLLPLFPQASLYYLPFVYTMAIISITYASFTTIRQIDLKRVIAYSSVAHMNLAVLGIFSFNVQGISGSIILMLGHGVVSGALFLMLGMLYNRYNSKLIYYFGGLATAMPIFSFFFLVFNLSNLGMPGTSNFIGEALILFGVFNINTLTAFLGCISMILSSTYSLWMYNRVTFGTLKLEYTKFYIDINRREFFMLFPLFITNLIIGIYPNFILNLCYPTVKLLTLLIFKV